MELVTSLRIVCLGEGMVEERVAADGAITRWHGGDMLNVAIHLARLGRQVALASALGTDAQSDALLRAWQTEGVDIALILRDPRRRAGRYRITVDSAGERSFSYDRAQSAARTMFASADAGWREAVAGGDLLVFSLISLAILPEAGREALIELARMVRGRSGLVAFDGNYRPQLWESAAAARKWRDLAIQQSDFGLPTLEDEQSLGGIGDAAIGLVDVADHWRALGCREVVVKAGAAGCLLPDGLMLAPPKLLAPVDTSGAGDAFDAGYLAARLAGEGPREAARAGHRLAGWAVMRNGAIPPSDAEAPYA